MKKIFFTIFAAVASLAFLPLVSCTDKNVKKNDARPVEQVTILNVRGKILRQSSQTLRWESLSGARPIYYGDLISFEDNSSARIYYDGRMRAVIEVRGPTLFRVSRQPPSASAFKSLNASVKKDKSEEATTQSSGVMSQIQTKPINFLWPLGPMTIVSEKFPVYTSVSAALPTLDSRLILSLYDLSRKQAEVWSAASFNGKFKKIMVPKAGLYRVILRSDDGRYLNESLTIEAKTKIGNTLDSLQNRVVEIM